VVDVRRAERMVGDHPDRAARVRGRQDVVPGECVEERVAVAIRAEDDEVRPDSIRVERAIGRLGDATRGADAIEAASSSAVMIIGVPVNLAL